MTEGGQQGDNGIQDGLLDLTFVPEWARKPSGDNPYITYTEKKQRPRREGRPGRKPGRRDSGRPRPPRESRGDAMRRMRDSSRRQWQEERPPPRLPLHISFLPERKGLGVIVKKIHQSNKAYALPDVASLFLAKPEFYLVKAEIQRRGGAADIANLYECKICRAVFTQRDAVIEHAAQQHMEHFFDIEETDSGEPAGQFPCVARCPMSGELIGPPNHHTYSERLQQIHAARFSHMPLDDYKNRLELIHDEEAINEWKQQSRIQRLYKPKDEENAEPMKRAAARVLLADRLAPRIVREGTRFIVPATVAEKMEDPDIREMIRDAWNRESKFPTTLIHALRPALRHMRLHLFKASEKATFITAIKPSPMDPSKAVEPIREALEYLQANPGCTRGELVSGFTGDADNPEKEEAVIKSLHWLIERGHVIEFSDGRMSVPVSSNRAAAG